MIDTFDTSDLPCKIAGHINHKEEAAYYYNQSIYLYGSNMERLKIVGLGDKKTFSSDKLRATFANVVRDVNAKKVDKPKKVEPAKKDKETLPKTASK